MKTETKPENELALSNVKEAIRMIEENENDTLELYRQLLSAEHHLTRGE